jgi:hypothetical protein
MLGMQRYFVGDIEVLRDGARNTSPIPPAPMLAMTS